MADEMNKEREALRKIGEEQAFEAWFKMDCPVGGANAKIAAKAAWKARASLAASAGSEAVAWRYVPSKVWGDKVFTDDPVRAEDARQAGCIVEPLYTHPSPPEGAGTVSVPKEPTAEMKLAAQKADMDHSDHEEWLHENWPDFKRVWDAMIAAAPPASEAKGAT